MTCLCRNSVNCDPETCDSQYCLECSLKDMDKNKQKDEDKEE